MQKILFNILLLVSLTSCATVVHKDVSSSFLDFENEKLDIQQRLGCSWESKKYDYKLYEKVKFGCHDGNVDAVSLYIYEDIKVPSRVDKIEMFWRNWNKEVYVDTAEKEAGIFALFLADKFLPEGKRKEFLESFAKVEEWSYLDESIKFNLSIRAELLQKVYKVEVFNKAELMKVETKVVENPITGEDAKTNSNVDSKKEDILDLLQKEFEQEQKEQSKEEEK